VEEMTAIAAPITLWVNDGMLVQHVSLHDAIRLLYLEKAEIVEAHDDVYIRSANGEEIWPMPKILRLIRHVKLHLDKIYGSPQVSKHGVLGRDNHTCAYCGDHANTVDHVQPRSRGGRSSWLNLVAACRDCNNRKRDRTPEEAGMKLRVTPFEPKRKAFGFMG
jgi:5-methylcytosine-specific restriction endonuclease McrA